MDKERVAPLFVFYRDLNLKVAQTHWEIHQLVELERTEKVVENMEIVESCTSVLEIVTLYR